MPKKRTKKAVMMKRELYMTEKWTCGVCGFPENFLPTCSACGHAPIIAPPHELPSRKGRRADAK